MPSALAAPARLARRAPPAELAATTARRTASRVALER